MSDWSSVLCASDPQAPLNSGQAAFVHAGGENRIAGVFHAPGVTCQVPLTMFRQVGAQSLGGRCDPQTQATPVDADIAHEQARLLPGGIDCDVRQSQASRSAEHTSELPSLMRSSYAVLCLKTKTEHIRT